ncbi:MAG: hypothetical protein HC880_18495 [Bacteroidia bacterium]|nr:hypothetical protein [Bacteroidia bacterium]
MSVSLALDFTPKEWPESKLRRILPWLEAAGEITGDLDILRVAQESSEFLEEVTMKEGYLSPVGNQGWYSEGGEPAHFDQQPIDVLAMVMMFQQAYVTTHERSYIHKMFTSFLWFLGENDLRIPLYDYETCGCCDGLEATGVNRNQGAESTLAYLISHLTVLNTLELEYVLNDQSEKQVLSERAEVALEKLPVHGIVL